METKSPSSFDIRQKFLDYFKKNGHAVVASSSLIPADDPTLLFANAGMNQFKDVFLGKEKRSYTRATSSQKCVRAGGKHNDLDEVGFTNRHLTFFEMLGNFSFGDYFKKEAIDFCWEFLTKEMGLDPKTLCVSVYKTDDESYDFWHKRIGVSKEKIYRLGEADNFWQMGDTGPCGPCTEVHVDNGPDIGCKKKDCDPSCDCPRFNEIWNLVFMQYNRQSDGSLVPLKQTGVDTGMGLERLSMVMQGKDSIFHSDLFEFLIKKIELVAKKQYSACNEDLQAAFHVLCDHTRSSCLLIADGCSPSNEGRGYVLRKIIRRAALFTRKLTDDIELLPKLAEEFILTMSQVFPNLKESKKLILTVLKSEIERFAASLDQGQLIFEKYVVQNKKEGKKVIPGEQVFKLYDTYGFPPELTRVMALDQGFTIDMEGFEKEMGKQRAQSGKKEETASVELQIPEGTISKFVGYDALETKSKVVFVQRDGDAIWLATEETPFYVEAGGQVGDKGWITINDKMIPVIGLDKIDEVTVVKVKAEGISVGDEAHCVVDYYKRVNAEKNHTATHLLQAALVDAMGSHVKQAGSLVNEEYLRFDFTSHEPMTKEQIAQVEQVVNQKIQEDIELKMFYTSLADAQEKGVTAFFGEKYNPERVRVVQVPGFSAELCGGTHVNRTGEIGCLKIVSEAALATGTRRIVALTGPEAIKSFQSSFSTVKSLSEEFKVKLEGVHAAVKKEREKSLELSRELKQLRKKLIKANVNEWKDLVEKVGDVPFLFLSLKGYGADDLKQICQEVEKVTPGVYFLLSREDSYRFVGYVSKGIDVDLRPLSKILKDKCNLRGGGKPDFIQGGGVDVSADAVRNCVKEWLS